MFGDQIFYIYSISILTILLFFIHLYIQFKSLGLPQKNHCYFCEQIRRAEIWRHNVGNVTTIPPRKDKKIMYEKSLNVKTNPLLKDTLLSKFNCLHF